MSEHPPSFRLDAQAAGDHDARVAEHVKACEACTRYIADASRSAVAFRDEEGAKVAEFLLALEKRSLEDGGALEAAPGAIPSETSERRRRGWLVLLPRAGWTAGAILAAAAVLLLVRGGAQTVTNPVPVQGEPATRFKGKVQLAVIRDRAGDQSRIAREVRVRPGDRLRVEIGVDDARPIEIGFLGKDGTWVLLLAPAVIEAGTHFSERAARFDDTPTEGWIIAGHPDDVKRAKMTRAFDDVGVIPVVAEP